MSAESECIQHGGPLNGDYCGPVCDELTALDAAESSPPNTREEAMKPYYQDEAVTLFHGDALDVLRSMPDQSVDCCVTSPPYFGLRDYGEEGQYGSEASPAEYVETMRALFAEVRRVLADEGTLWLNLGDSYAAGSRSSYASTGKAAGRVGASRPTSNLPGKNLLGMPWRVAFALQDDGWILRNDIIWSKPNAMPESVTDRLSTRHEHLFMFSKSSRYWFDLDPIREQYEGDRSATRRARSGHVNKENSAKGEWSGEHEGRNPGDVWNIATQPFPGAHFAVMPLALADRCIKAGCHEEGVVLDPFSGSGTTGLAAARNWREYVGIDLNADYLDLSLRTRLQQATLSLGDAS